MSFEFRPAVFKGGALFELPRPVIQLRINDRWDFANFKVPMRSGDYLTGHSRHGVEITLEGQFGRQGTALSLSEEEMFVVWETMRDVLDVRQDSEKYEFFLYFNGSDGGSRKWKGCSTVRLECDLSNKHLFEYALTLHAEDARLFSTGPGE